MELRLIDNTGKLEKGEVWQKMKGHSTNNIQAIIFDYGNVITRFDNNTFLQKISKFTPKTASELYELIYVSSGLPVRYETGLMSSDDFFNELVKLCSFSTTKAEFIKIFTGIFTPIKTTIDLIKKLKPKYKLGLLSNTNEVTFEHEIKKNEVFGLFDAVALSYKIKAMKPDKKIFLDILRKLQMMPGECIFIDDIEANVAAATKIGMHGIHYVSHDKLTDSLKQLNVVL